MESPPISDIRVESTVTAWHFRVLRRYGLCEKAARLAAENRTIWPPDFARLVLRGCPPRLALRILAPLDWAPSVADDKGCRER